MKRSVTRLSLNRETLRALSSSSLAGIAAAGTSYCISCAWSCGYTRCTCNNDTEGPKCVPLG